MIRGNRKRDFYRLGLGAALLSVVAVSPVHARTSQTQSEQVALAHAHGAQTFPSARAISAIGMPVSYRDYPWQIGLRIKTGNGARRCGGILISARYILTAAHCVDLNKPEHWWSKVPAKVSQITAFRASNAFGQLPITLDASFPVTIHPQYKTGRVQYQYDAALLRLAAPLEGAITAPVRTVPVTREKVPQAVVSGWGEANDGTTGTLRAISEMINDLPTCARQAVAEVKPSLTDVTLCTVHARVGACLGDSGGPMVIGARTAPQTIGIVSFHSATGCGVPDAGHQLVGGFTRASMLTPWIEKVTGDSKATTDVMPGNLMDLRDSGGGSK
jgi:Trypsin